MSTDPSRSRARSALLVASCAAALLGCGGASACSDVSATPARESGGDTAASATVAPDERPSQQGRVTLGLEDASAEDVLRILQSISGRPVSIALDAMPLLACGATDIAVHEASAERASEELVAA